MKANYDYLYICLSFFTQKNTDQPSEVRVPCPPLLFEFFQTLICTSSLEQVTDISLLLDIAPGGLSFEAKGLPPKARWRFT